MGINMKEGRKEAMGKRKEGHEKKTKGGKREKYGKRWRKMR